MPAWFPVFATAGSSFSFTAFLKRQLGLRVHITGYFPLNYSANYSSPGALKMLMSLQAKRVRLEAWHRLQTLRVSSFVTQPRARAARMIKSVSAFDALIQY